MVRCLTKGESIMINFKKEEFGRISEVGKSKKLARKHLTRQVSNQI